MKFIHFSDIRIGNNSESGTPWADARLSELENGLRRVMEEAAAHTVDLVILSGGLFSHTPVTAELDEVSALFAEYSEIDVVLIAGETDRIRRSSPVRSYTWPSNVHFFNSGNVGRAVISRKHTEVFGASVTDGKSADLDAFVKALNEEHPDRQRVRIVVLRSDKDKEIGAAFAGMDYSYAAVGSPVMGSRTISAKVHCPGFFEPDTMGDHGQHGILEGQISETTGILEHIEFLPMSAASYVPLVIKTTIKTTEAEADALVRKEIEKRGETNIYRLKLIGSRSPEVRFDLAELRRDFRISEIIDNTEPEYDYRELFAEHSQDLIGYYIAKIVNSGHEMSPLEKRAMYCGLDALLHSSEE